MELEQPSGAPDTILVSEVRPDPKQPRTYFRESALRALATSLKTIGQRTPIEVRCLPEGSEHKYEIIDGERRWRACRLAGIERIRASIETQELDARQQHLLSVVSNFHREGHTHMEISNALAFQIKRGATPGELAKHLGKSQSWVSQYMSIQRLSPQMQQMLSPLVADAKRLRFSEAVALSAMAPEDQEATYLEMLELDVRRRLPFIRKQAEDVTGKPRTQGRKRDIPYEIASKLLRIRADLEFILDVKQQEFLKGTLLVKTYDIRQVIEGLHELGLNINPMINALEEVQMVE